MAEQFYYDAEELRRMIDQELDELRRIRFSEKYTAVLGEAFVQKVRDWENAIRRQKELPYTIVVCGSFKRGKSTLINALLGEDVTTTDITTETITLNRISYGEHANALVLPSGKRMVLTDEQIHRSQLEQLLAGLGEETYQLELRRPIELLKHVTIVDTPGLDDSLQDYEGLVSQALLQADAVVYVFSSAYPLSMQEQLYLRTTVLPQKHTDLFLVSNYADLMRNDKEFDRMAQEIAKRTEVVLPSRPFYMLSALDERCRQLEVNRPNPQMAERLAANFDRFRAEITRMVDEKSDVILVDRMERMLQGMREELFALLDVMEQGLKLDSAQAYDQRRQAEQSLQDLDVKQTQVMNDITAGLKTDELETVNWMQELVEKMRRETAMLRSVELTYIRRYYSLFCVDTLQKALTLCMEYHTQKIFEQLDAISGELTQRAVKSIQGAHTSFSFSINNKTWTKGDNVGFLANRLGGGGILSLVGMTIGGSMRQSEMKKNTSDVFADIDQQYVLLLDSLPATVARAYANLRDRVLEQVREYFSDRSAQLHTQTEQIISFAQRSEAEKQQAMELIRAVRTTLEEMKL